MVVKKKRQTFHSLQEEELQLELGEIIARNMAKRARRQFRGRHLLFGEYLRSWADKPKRTLSKKSMNLINNIDAGKHVAAVCF